MKMQEGAPRPLLFCSRIERKSRNIGHLPKTSRLERSDPGEIPLQSQTSCRTERYSPCDGDQQPRNEEAQSAIPAKEYTDRCAIVSRNAGFGSTYRRRYSDLDGHRGVQRSAVRALRWRGDQDFGVARGVALGGA